MGEGEFLFADVIFPVFLSVSLIFCLFFNPFSREGLVKLTFISNHTNAFAYFFDISFY